MTDRQMRRPRRPHTSLTASAIATTVVSASALAAADIAALTAKSCGLAVSPCRRAPPPVVAPPGRELHAFHCHISPAPYSPTAPHDCKQPLAPRLPSRPRPPLSQSPLLRTVGTRQQELLPGSQPASQPAKHSTPPPLAYHWHLAGCCDGKCDGLAGHVRERTTSLRAQTSTAWSEQSPLPVLRPARHAGDRRAAHHVAQCMSGRVARRGGAVLQSRGLDGSTLHLHGQRIARARGRAHDVGRLGSGRRDVRRGLRVDSCATSGREKLVGAVRGIAGGRASLGC